MTIRKEVMFSDEDVKTLKEMARTSPIAWLESFHRTKSFDLGLLLARLEAAEALIKLYSSVNAWDAKKMNKLLEEWKKAAGK